MALRAAPAVSGEPLTRAGEPWIRMGMVISKVKGTLIGLYHRSEHVFGVSKMTKIIIWVFNVDPSSDVAHTRISRAVPPGHRALSWGHGEASNGHAGHPFRAHL